MAEPIERKYRRLVQDPEALETEGRDASQINLEDVEQDLSTHCERFLEWARLTVMAEADYKVLKDELAKVSLSAKQKARQELNVGGKKPTEAQIEEAAGLDQTFLKHQEIFTAQWKIWQLFKVVEESMEQRYQMLQSLNARQCKELGMYRDDPETYAASRQTRRDTDAQIARLQTKIRGVT